MKSLRQEGSDPPGKLHLTGCVHPSGDLYMF